MSTHYNRLAVSSAYSAANYLPAMLKTNKSGWLIEYYVENPQTQELSRKRIKLQRLLSVNNNRKVYHFDGAAKVQNFRFCISHFYVQMP